MIDREALTKQIKEANDIVDVVGSYVNLQPAGAKFKGLCPFHDDQRPSFDVDPRFQNYRCWACGKFGDVFTFIQDMERVDFREAREVLARRAGITLEKTADSPQNRGRALMLEVVRWAAEEYHACLLDAPFAEAARKYLGERRLSGETVRKYGLGFAPGGGAWLVDRASKAKIAFDILEQVGLIAQRDNGEGHYDRFRDRVLFPIRNIRGQTVGFGGRVLPSSPLAAKAPKYYNSADTPLFTKSEQLYGIDAARMEAAKAGYLAVVEGYTDVLMAHQLGIHQVVATMGTALNARHVGAIRRVVPRVVLVFDADAGGKGGVDRALEIFASQDVDLAIATLPEGMDPCDLLVARGPEPFKEALAHAVDALDFKLQQLLADPAAASVEGRRRAIDAVLGIIALAPELPGQAGIIKRQLILSRIAQRLALSEEMVRARLRELMASRRPETPGPKPAAEPAEKQAAPAAARELQLLQVLLAEPRLVAPAAAQIAPEDVAHPGLRKLLEGLYARQAGGLTPDLDGLRPQIDNPRLVESALRLQEVGLRVADRDSCLKALVAEFRSRRELPRIQELRNQLQAARDHSAALELLRQLQTPKVNTEI